MNVYNTIKLSDSFIKTGRIYKKPFVNFVGVLATQTTRELDFSRNTNRLNGCISFYKKNMICDVRNLHSTFINNENVVQNPPLNKENAHNLVMRLTVDERNALMTVLREFESELTKAEYKGQLAAFRWRSKFGRPSKLPSLGEVDPTGSYCPVPEDWLLRKYAETIPKPTSNQLFSVAIHNATPFVGFGFLDNFFMIICGDYIELYLGSVITISTMAAAALGNTLSDILGIGSAFYVERAVSKIGIKPPNLSPIQLDMTSSRLAANWGRVIGVTIGCLLGMFPLLFKKDDKKSNAEEHLKA